MKNPNYYLSLYHKNRYKYVINIINIIMSSFGRLYKVTTFGGVPFVFEILKKIKFEKIYLHYLKYVTQAGGKLSDKLLIEMISIFKKKKLRLIVMYGQTEASPRMSYLPWRFLSKKIGSIGKPINGGKFYIFDKN